MEYTTISISKETADRFKQKRRVVREDSGTNLGNDRFLEILLNHWEDGESWIGEPKVVMIDELKPSLGVIEERVNSIDRTLDELTQT